MTTEKNIVLMVSAPRSGTTALLELIESMSNALNLLEIFHVNEDVAKQHLRRGFSSCGHEGNAIDKAIHSNVWSRRRDKPGEFLAHLLESTTQNTVLLKIFPGHLAMPKVEDLVSKMVSHVWIHTRSPLDTFISNEKAKIVGTYATVDTTSLKIEFNGDDFRRWKNHQLKFFEAFYGELNPLGVAIETRYEGVFADKRHDHNLQQICRALNIEANAETTPVTTLRRQDSNESPLEKVSNPAQLQEFLLREGADMEHLLPHAH